MSLRVLVTGAGSVVGQGIVKALRLSGIELTVVASDISALNAGLYRADDAILLPRVESNGALQAICAALEVHQIDAVLIGSEFDIAFFAAARARIEAETGARVVVSPVEVVAIAEDKLKTARFLAEHRLPHAAAAAADAPEDAIAAGREFGFPCVLKPRSGSSSRHVHIVGDEDELRFHLPRVPRPMVQRMIAPPTTGLGQEYTCALFRTPDGRVLGPFTARRTLRGGSSWVVEVREFTELHRVLHDIATALPFSGPLNVQLIVGENGPVPFEFNARFSGTTAIRAHFGFNDPAMAVESFVLGARLETPCIRQGVALRYEEEVFIDGPGAEQLALPLPRGEVHHWF